MNELSFGAHDSEADVRTVKSDQVTAMASIMPAGAKVDFSQPPVSIRYDQFKVGECTSCASTKVAEYRKKAQSPYAPEWGYLMTKILLDGNLTEGSSALANLKRMKGYGIPTKAVQDKYPLDTQNGYDYFIQDFQNRYEGKIPQEILDDAASNKIAGYYSVSVDQDSIANQIAAGNPLILRIAVGTNTYMDAQGNFSMSATKLLPLRAPNPATGGHLIACNEYKAAGADMELSGPNSWGLRWCPETEGCWSFLMSTYKPYLTEAWAITLDPVENLFRHEFKSDIKYGQSGEEVVALQRYLQRFGFLKMPEGVKMGYYGDITAKAALRFQITNAVALGSVLMSLAGKSFGPASRSSANRLQGF